MPPITLPKGTQPSQISVASNGVVTVAGNKVGQIKLVQVTAPDKLLPQGNSVYAATAASGPVQTAKGVTMQQGYLEQSNVDINHQISNMMTAEQAYSEGLAFEDMLVNELSQQLAKTMYGGGGMDGSSSADGSSSDGTDGTSSGGTAAHRRQQPLPVASVAR